MYHITAEDHIKRGDNIPYKEIEKEGIILKLTDGDYFTVNEVGLFVWKSLNGTKDLAHIAERISSRYKINKKVALSDLIEFIKILSKRGLITMCTVKKN